MNVIKPFVHLQDPTKSMNLPKILKVFFASRFRLHVVAHWARSIVFAPNLVEAVKEVLVVKCYVLYVLIDCGF